MEQQGFESRDHDSKFNELLRQNDVKRDEGIEAYDNIMREARAELRQRYIEGERVSIDHSELEKMKAELYREWPFSSLDQTAIVSGNLRVVEDDDEGEFVSGVLADSVVIDDEGNVVCRSNDRGEMIFSVCNARLDLHDIIVTGEYDEAGAIKDFHVEYEFTHPDDEHSDLFLWASPDDLFQHVYEEVTPMEAEMRLEYAWPDQYRRIGEIFLYGDGLSMTERLQQASSEFAGEFENTDFRELFTAHVNELLELDQELPYASVLSGNVHVVHDDEVDTTVAITGDLAIDLYQPLVCVECDDSEESLGLYLRAETYNQEDGDEPETLLIPVEGLKSLRSTRTQRSLASRAIEGAVTPESSRVASEPEGEVEVTYVPVQNVETQAADEESLSPRAERLDQLALLEGTLQSIKSMVDSMQQVPYKTREAALRQGESLCNTIESMLSGTIAHMNVEVSAMGNVPVLALVKDEDGDLVFGHRLLAPGESVGGVICSDQPVVPFIEVVTGEDPAGNEVDVYIATPSLLLSLDDTVGMGVIVGSVMYQQHYAQNRVAVPLNSSADISLVELDDSRRLDAALESAQKCYGEDSSIMRRLAHIRAELDFDNEVSSDEPMIVEPRRLTGFAKDLLRQVGHLKGSVRRKQALPAVEVLECMLQGKAILMQGEVYERTASEFEISSDYYEQEVAWGVHGVEISDDMHEIMLSVVPLEGSDVLYYIPLSSLSLFARAS